MSTSINQGSIQASVSVTYNGTVGENGVDTASLPVAYLVNQALANGTGANQAEVIYKDNRTLAAGASDTIDLHGGTFKDAFGNGIVLSKVLALVIKNAGGSSGTLTVGDAATNAWAAALGATGTVIVDIGGALVLIAPSATGYPVSSASFELKVLNNGAGNSTYDILVIGN